MKFVIYKRDNEVLGDKLGSYESDFKDDTNTNRSHEMAEPKAIHIPLPDGLDEDMAMPVWMELEPEQVVTLREPIEAQDEVLDENDEVIQEAIEAQPGLYQTIPAVIGWGLVEDPEKRAAKDEYDSKAVARGLKFIIEDAKAFGNDLMNDFTVENMMMGITQDGMTSHVRKTMSEVILALTTGSLYDAIAEAKAIPEVQKDAKYITDARLLSFVNRIEAYLKKPLSESL